MNLKLHHIGILVDDIQTQHQVYQDRFGYELQGDVIHDAVQTAYVQFLKLSSDQVYLELVMPDQSNSKLTGALRTGAPFHHICYATDSIDLACQELRRKGMTLVRAPVAAPAFQGRRIAWLMSRDRFLVELVEQNPFGEGL